MRTRLVKTIKQPMGLFFLKFQISSLNPFLFLFLSLLLLPSCSDRVTRNYANLSRPEGSAIIPQSYERPARLYIANPPKNILKAFNLSGSAGSPITAPVGFFALEIPVGKFPHIVRASSDGQFLFVANEISRDISLVSVDKNLEVDIYPSSPTSLHLSGEGAKKGLTRLEFKDDSDENLRVADIFVMRYGETLDGELNEGETRGFLTSKALLSRVAFALPDAKTVKTFIFDPIAFYEDKSPLIEEFTFEFENLSPGLIRASQNNDFLWVADISEPLLARVRIKPPPVGAESGEKSDPDDYIGKIDYIELPGPAFDMETVPKRVYDGGAYPDRLYIMDRENAYLYILTADTLEFKEPYPRRYNVGRPGISLGNLSVIDLIMTDFYRPYFYDDTRGCEAQVAYVLSISGLMFGIDIGGCFPFDDGSNEPLARHLPHHLLDINPEIATVSEPLLVMPDDSVISTPEETAPAILGGDNPDENYGITIADGQSYSQRIFIAYRGEIPPRWDAPGVFVTQADVNGITVTLKDDEIDLTQSGVEIGDNLQVKSFTIINAATEEANDASGDASSLAECPLIPIAAITKNGIELSSPPPENCQGKNLAISFRASDGWVVRGSYDGYLGRQFEDGVYRPFPQGPGGYIVEFAMKPADATIKRMTDTKIILSINSNIAFLRLDAGVAGDSAATLPFSTSSGRHYPGAPLMLYLVFAGSEAVFPMNLELHDLFPSTIMR